jgi:hypothetical protein
MTTTKKRKAKAANGRFTMYLDSDRAAKLITAEAILAEYRRLQLPPVSVGGYLVSPAAVEVLKQYEPKDYTPRKAQDAPGPPESQQGGGDA